MASYADLEIRIERRNSDTYAVRATFTLPDSDTGIDLPASEVRFDSAALLELQQDPKAYGKALGEMLFGEPGLRQGFANARASAQSQGVPLRVMLRIGDDDLQSLRWETLIAPDDGEPLALSEQIIFSRFVTSSDERPMRLRARGELRALVVIAAPSDLERYSLAPINAAAEQSSAITRLEKISAKTLTQPGQATLANMVEQLREGSDILYIVAHSSVIDGDASLFLDNGEGQVAVTRGDEFAERIAELRDPPRLVLLFPSQSASDGSTQGLNVIGQRLIAVGVPVVVASQGALSTEAAERFTQTLFSELGRDGQIDRAVAIARHAIADQPDWWAPMLLTRLRSGMIWYEAGFGDKRSDFEKYPALLRAIKEQRCTPIIGPGLLEPYIGSQREIARRMAEKYTFPLSPEQRDDLSQVTQYLAVSQDSQFPLIELRSQMRDGLIARYGEVPKAKGAGDDLMELLARAGSERRQAATDPHRVLAELPLPIYVSANPDTLLEDALRAANREPVAHICAWNDQIEQPSGDTLDVPTVERPLVFYLLGQLGVADSLVLTDDDYRNFQLEVARNKELIPTVVREALSDSALLWLGFQAESNNFKTLQNVLAPISNTNRRPRYSHIIQIEEGPTLQAAATRRYMETYLSNANLSIFWGTPEDFTARLHTQMEDELQSAKSEQQPADAQGEPFVLGAEPASASESSPMAQITQTTDAPQPFNPADIAQTSAPPMPPPITTAPPAEAPPAPRPITVMIQTLKERYRPPNETLCIEIYSDQVCFRHHNTDYASPHTLVEHEADLRQTLALDPRQHGELLFRTIFCDQQRDGALSTRIGYEQALAQALAQSNHELRIELNLRDRQLDKWRWEYLRDPNRAGDLPLATSERSPLYRRPLVAAPANTDTAVARPLMICVAICNPPGLGAPGNSLLQKLAPVDVARQQEIICDALEPLKKAGIADYLVLGGSDGKPATLENIGAALDSGCHMLHLLAHGITIGDTYHLVMENAREGNQRPFVSANDFRDTLLARGSELRLVLLASCRSAVASELLESGSSLGATLVEGGVPAVIAMQDLVAVNTVQFFTQHFYDDLARSGRVDMAVAATRYDLYQWLRGTSPDWGIPVLYMGPGDGRLFDIDAEQVLRRLPTRTPVIKSFTERRTNDDQISRQVAQIVAEHTGGMLAPAQIEALRAAVTPSTAPQQEHLAPQQRRDEMDKLRRPLAINADDLQRYVERQEDGLVLDQSVYAQVAAALSIGKHVILIGPPGTGKTSVAHHICRFVAECGIIADTITTTASADWSTFDTVGGYVPTPQGTLQFRPGIFLRAICDGRWLVIDEINRAEIDKAFGELFTVLSGQPVDLPYWVGEHQVRVIPGLRQRDPAQPWVPATVGSPYDYVVHPNWRIIGAMNVYDKSSLFTMSFALMRRFAFIELDVPPVEIYRSQLIGQWLREGSLPEADHPALTDIICSLLEASTLMSRRALGPAIIKDLVHHIASGSVLHQPDLLPSQVAEAFMLYALPQLDALDQETISAIYSELRLVFGDSAVAATMFRRIRTLYPHIRKEEWPQ